jgi:hypothetical protein
MSSLPGFALNGGNKMNNLSLCASCLNCFCFTAVNQSGGSGNKTKVKCLVNPEAFNDLVWGMYKETEPYPYIATCSHYLPVYKKENEQKLNYVDKRSYRV